MPQIRHWGLLARLHNSWTPHRLKLHTAPCIHPYIRTDLLILQAVRKADVSSATCCVVLQAEQKAADASNQAQELLHRLQNSWTPHWLDQRLSSSQKWVSSRVLSGPGGKQNTAGRYLSLAQAKLTAFYQQAKVDFPFLLFSFASAQLFAGVSAVSCTAPAFCNS